MKDSINNKIANELLELINSNASVAQISRWADNVYSNFCRDLDPETDRLIAELSFMQHGPEFVISRSDLETIAKRLMEIG